MPEETSGPGESSGSASGLTTQTYGKARGPAATYDVFVSHTSAPQDKVVADAIVSRLEQAGIRCWVAPRDVIPGTVYAEAIIEAIAACRLMVVVLSGEANHSRHVQREVERAIANNVIIIPFRTELVEPSGAMAYFLASEHWLDAMTPPLETHISRLVEVASVLLQREAPRDSAPAAPPPPAPRLPFPPPPGQPAQRSGWRGRRGWLVAALVLAVAGLAAGLAITLLSPGSQAPVKPAAPRPAAPRMVALSQLTAGECIRAPAAYERTAAARKNFWTNSNIPMPARVPVVSCRQPHSGEVFFAGNAWPAGGSYPGGQAIDGRAKAACRSAFQKYVGISFMSSYLGYIRLNPDQSTWASGDRSLTCIAYDPSGNNSRQSVRNSRR